MHSLTIALRDNQTVWTLMFKSKEAADAVWAKMAETTAHLLEDDFGQKVFLATGALAGAVLEDLELSKLAHIERALHNARTNAKAHSMAAGDPMLRAASLTQGPAVLGNGAGFSRQ